MTTSYPNALDSFSVKIDGVDDVMAAHVNDLQDGLVAAQAAIGVKGLISTFEARLTLTASTPVTTADVTGATTVRLTPYNGTRVAVFNIGTTKYDIFSFSEITIAVPSTTTTPFDIFVGNSGSGIALATLDWSNDTTRAVGLTRTDNIWHLTGGQNFRYIGTGRTTSVSGQCEDSVTKRFLWNYYHRFLKRMARQNTTSHTYNTATTRPFNNDAANSQVEFIIGLLEEPVMVGVRAEVARLAYDNGVPTIAAAINSTSSQMAGSQVGMSGHIGGLSAGTRVSALPSIGYNYICAVEHAVVDITAATFAATNLDCTLRC